MTLDQARELLGVDASAAKAEVDRRYRHLAMTTHPDARPEDVVGATSRMAELNMARDLALEHAPDEAPPPACSWCGGTKKTKVKWGFSDVLMACPKCTVEGA